MIDLFVINLAAGGDAPDKYRPRFNPSNLAGLKWLVQTLGKILRKGESHPSYRLAVGAVEGFDELRQWVESAHTQLHAKDAEIASLKDEAETLRNKVRDLTSWVESLNAIIEAAEKKDEAQEPEVR